MKTMSSVEFHKQSTPLSGTWRILNRKNRAVHTTENVTVEKLELLLLKQLITNYA